MKAILLMLGALSAAIIFVGCGTAVGRATGVETSEVEQVIDANERAEYVEKTCKTQLITAINKQQSGFTTKDSILSDADANAFMEECLERIEAELATEGETGTDVEKAVEEAKQEVEIVKAGAEQVVEEKAMLEDLQGTCLREYRSPETRRSLRGKSLGQFMKECMDEGSKELAVLGDIDSDVEKAVAKAEQKQVQTNLAACQRESRNPYARKGKSVGQFVNECMAEATANDGLSAIGDIDSDVEKAVAEANQEVEIVRAGAEAVLAERELMETAQTRCYADSLVPRKRRGIPLDAFMAQCISKAASASGVTGDIDFYINKAVEAAQQEMAVAKAEADRAEEEREVIRTATRLCQRDSLDASKRKGKPRNDFINDCIRESAANRDGSGEIDSDIEKEVETAEQELDIVKAGAEEVFEERVASLEEKVAELTELLEALQTQ